MEIALRDIIYWKGELIIYKNGYSMMSKIFAVMVFLRISTHSKMLLKVVTPCSKVVSFLFYGGKFKGLSPK